jgi:soluble lytic murein transglycosylase
MFPQAREQFQKVLDNYPNDPGLPQALFGMGRSLMWEREYARAIPYLDRVSREYPNTKEGREGLAFKGACNVRLGNNAEAAKIYEQYTIMYPTGERIDTAYLNTIDALRESGQYDAANSWVDKSRLRFAGQPVEMNALHARLRMNIFRGHWADARSTADQMLGLGRFGGSMTGSDEVRYLKAVALENLGGRDKAQAIYSSIPDTGLSYFGGLAAERLRTRGRYVTPTANISGSEYPVVFRDDVLAAAKPRKIDPRFVLAIMKQESTFKPGAKSPSAARGLLQLVFDTALKYNVKAGYPGLQPDDLYNTRTNITIGCEYIAALKDEFGGLYEAIAASYNGGEDNAARWLNRSKPKEPGIFASEIGFAETKNYVFKVMNNYRAYRELYDENLNRK